MEKEIEKALKQMAAYEALKELFIPSIKSLGFTLDEIAEMFVVFGCGMFASSNNEQGFEDAVVKCRGTTKEFNKLKEEALKKAH